VVFDGDGDEPRRTREARYVIVAVAVNVHV
jgi:hypothetical protein